MLFFKSFVIIQTLWKLSSVGRASALQAEGHRFEPYSFHHTREWLSGRASPCQGECREFESRLPLHFFIRHHSQVVRQRSAKPLSPVQIWVVPPIKCRSGGIGRRKGLKIPRSTRPYRFKSGLRHQRVLSIIAWHFFYF